MSFVLAQVELAFPILVFLVLRRCFVAALNHDAINVTFASGHHVMRLPFSKRLSSKNAADIDIARAARDKIAARLAAAERAVAEHHANVRQLALTDADDAALEAAESAMRMAQDRVRTLSDGLHEADESIRQAEQRRDAADDLKRRAETAAVIDDVAERLGEVGSEFAGLMQKMAALTERAVALTPDASGLHGFCGRALIEIPESAELLSQVLRDIANATRNGSAPASLPRPEREAQPTRHVPPATTRVFTTRPIKWLDANGDLRIQPEFFDIDLPPDIAARAIELDAAVPIDHPRRRQMLGHGRVYRPDPARCVSLIEGDTTQPQPRPELVPGVAFEPMPVETGARYHVNTFGV
ncbi:MAG: hypothetical protein BGP05_21945 [Rhizobiales bacterium 62-47]|nr:MAG: hypothetical protein BGP05_21945 [Rhizobiales bacterium 62-47]